MNIRSFSLQEIGINRVRDEIINVVYLVASMVGSFSFYGAIVRIFRQGYHPIIIFYFSLFFSLWTIFLLRKSISTSWKAGIFFILFFLLGIFLNLQNSILSGGVHFIFVTTIITLLYGWRLGAASILLAILTRGAIAILYYKGILTLDYDLNNYVKAPPILFSAILGVVFTSAVIVFAINKFYNWLLNLLQEVTEKVRELEKMNTALDIAKTKAIENDRLKTVFLSNMSHEVRTPMNAIIGFASLLVKPSLEETKRIRFSSLIKERSFDLLRLIEDILDISKIESGQLKMVESDTNLEELLHEIYEFFLLKLNKTSTKNKIDLKLSIDQSVHKRKILIDKQRLKQVLNNLIENALKFTEKGSVEIGCKIDKQIHFYVKDTGIGIPPDKQKIIFDRFRQADDSYAARQFGGTGLGLSISKGILDLMGGEICLESAENKGASFYFAIPLKELNAVRAIEEPLPYKAFDFKEKSLLLVEDDFSSAELIKETLAGTNIRILHCYTFADSVKTLDNEPSVDIVLLDIRLPDKSGLELAKMLRANQSAIKIIAQSAYASPEDINECLTAGCDDFIAKPLDTDKLLSLLHSHLSAQA